MKIEYVLLDHNESYELMGTLL